MSSTGFIAGAATGASAGFTNGFITGLGNSLIQRNSFGNSLLNGLDGGRKQGLAGGISGGIAGGIDAMGKDVNFFSGKAQMDLSKGYGAQGVSTDQTITGKYVGKYEKDGVNTGVSVYESSTMKGNAGVTLPGRGIIVRNGAYSKNLYPNLMQHEFGHILEANKVGMVGYYGMIAKESVLSAEMNGHLGWEHKNFWTETWANFLSKEYWGSSYVWSSDFPVRDISWFNWIRLKQFSFLMP